MKIRIKNVGRYLSDIYRHFWYTKLKDLFHLCDPVKFLFDFFGRFWCQQTDDYDRSAGNQECRKQFIDVPDTTERADQVFPDKYHGTPADHTGYLMKTADGKILKCSTSYIHDDDGTLHYVFGINYDITKLTMIESALHSLVTPENKEEKPKEITHNVNDLLDHLIEESVALVGKPVPLMNKEDKVTAIQFLNDAGAFLITKSGDKVANYFGISKYTLYSYIDVNK